MEGKKLAPGTQVVSGSDESDFSIHNLGHYAMLPIDTKMLTV